MKNIDPFTSNSHLKSTDFAPTQTALLREAEFGPVDRSMPVDPFIATTQLASFR
jgi:hypothetical protein